MAEFELGFLNLRIAQLRVVLAVLVRLKFELLAHVLVSPSPEPRSDCGSHQLVESLAAQDLSCPHQLFHLLEIVKDWSKHLDVRFQEAIVVLQIVLSQWELQIGLGLREMIILAEFNDL